MANDADARRRGTDDHFTGRAAQVAVMAELLRLRCNVAVPEVDLGIDLFAFRDGHPNVVCLQVKACTVPLIYADRSGFSAKFSLPLRQLLSPKNSPPLFYILAVLRENLWRDYLILSRERLRTYLRNPRKFGSRNRYTGSLEITAEFRTQVFCSGYDVTDGRNAWSTLPPFDSLPGHFDDPS